jgi:mercuric reductase
MITSEHDYDMLVIGSGGAGMAAAIRASELGATVAVVEAAEVIGGTCVNVGCIPSKYLIEAAHHYHTARTGLPGIAACRPDLAWAEVRQRKADIIAALRQEKYHAVLASYERVTLLRGRAELLGDGRVRVGVREVRAGRIVIATGTRPAMPPVPGLAAAGALDSTSVMELERLPASMIVIGGGAIGLELGQAYARFGVRVSVFEMMERILPDEDADVSASLAAALAVEGIKIRTGVEVTAVSRDDRGFIVRTVSGSRIAEDVAEQLLVASGRRPNTEGLGLAAARVAVDDRGFIAVDAHMRTSNPDVFAAGDVVGGPGFVYVAALGGGVAAAAALAEGSSESRPIDLAATPRVTFTDPQVAAVGLTEQQAQARGHRTSTTTLQLDRVPRAIVAQRTSGIVKLIADEATGRLLGAHIACAHAGDFIGEAALAVRLGLTVEDIVSTLHAYLTWGEAMKLAGQTFTTDVSKLSCCA